MVKGNRAQTMENQKTKVTQELLDANPELVEQGIKIGDEIEITPVESKDGKEGDPGDGKEGEPPTPEAEQATGSDNVDALMQGRQPNQ